MTPLFLDEQRIKVVVFDVDGVLTQLFPSIWQLHARAAARTGMPVERVHAQYKAMEEGSGEVPVSLRAAFNMMWPDASNQQWMRYREAMYRAEKDLPYPAYPDTVPVLRGFQSYGIGMALCTANEPQVLQERLAAAFIDRGFFRATSDASWKFPKPDPRALMPVLEEFPGVTPQEMLFVGDSPGDWKTAHGADVHFVGVLTGATSKLRFQNLGVPEKNILHGIKDLPFRLKEKPS